MTHEIATQKGGYLTDLQQLDGRTLRDFVDPKHQASPQELQTLLAIVKNRNLNPFTKEVYFIKYGNNPAQIVVSKDAFMKRAEENPQFDGFEAGVVIETADGDIKQIEGTIMPKSATLLGGWCKVYRKDRSRPITADADLTAYNTGKSMWAKAPGLMIRKVAIVSAFREAFSENVGGLYTSEEMDQAAPVDVTPQESQVDVRARKMAQIEQMKQEQAERQPVRKEAEPEPAKAETADTSYPAEEIPLFDQLEDLKTGDDIELPFA